MKHRLCLLGLMGLTVVAVGAAAPGPWMPDPLKRVLAIAAHVVLAGLLVLLWAYWLRADGRQP